MLTWMSYHLPTILICAALVAVVASILRSMIKNARNGKTSCGCGCAGCPINGSCHSK